MDPDQESDFRELVSGHYIIFLAERVRADLRADGVAIISNVHEYITMAYCIFQAVTQKYYW